MTITWLGHSCFMLECSGFRVLLDPYCNVPGLPDFAAMTILTMAGRKTFV